MGLSRTFTGGGTRMRATPLILTPPLYVIYAHRPTGNRYVHVGWGNPALDNNFWTCGNDGGATPAAVFRSRARSTSANTALVQTVNPVTQDEWHVFLAGSESAASHFVAYDTLDTLVWATTSVAVWPTLTTFFVGTSDELSGNESGLQGQIAWCGVMASLPPAELIAQVMAGRDPLEVLGPWLLHFWRFDGLASEGQADLIGSAALAAQLGSPAESDHYPEPSDYLGVPILGPDLDIFGATRRRLRARVSVGDAYFERKVDLPDGMASVARVSVDADLLTVRVNADAAQTTAITGTLNAQTGQAVIGNGLAAGVVPSGADERELAYQAAFATTSTADAVAAAARSKAGADVLAPVVPDTPTALNVERLQESVIALTPYVDDPGGAGWYVSTIGPLAAAFGTLQAVAEEEDSDARSLSFTPAATLAEDATATVEVTIASRHPAGPAPATLTLALTAVASTLPNGFSAVIDRYIGHTTLTPMTGSISGALLTLSLSHAFLKTTGNGGKITNASGFDIQIEVNGTVCPYDRIAWDGTAGTAIFDIRLPVALGPSSDLAVRVYTGKAGLAVDQANPTAALADYAWVLDVLDGGDRTVNARDCTVTGTWATAAGLFGLAADLNGSTYGTVAAFGPVVTGLSDFSLEAVYRPDAINTDRGLVSIGDDLTSDATPSWSVRLDARGADSESGLGITPYPDVLTSVIAHSAGRARVESVRDTVKVQWTAMVEGLKAASPYQRFIDGVVKPHSLTEPNIGGSTNFAGALNIGRAALFATAGGFDGKIQSLRLAARPPDANRAWVHARNALAHDTFWGVGRGRTAADPAELGAYPQDAEQTVSDTVTYDVLLSAVYDPATTVTFPASPSPTASAGTISRVSAPLTGNTPAAGTTTEVPLAASTVHKAGHLIGRVITVGGEDRTITAYNETTKRAVVGTAFSSAVASGASYSIVYHKLRLVAPSTAQDVTISYPIADGASRTATGVMLIRVKEAEATPFEPFLGLGMGCPFNGTNFTNARMNTSLRNTYSGEAPLTGLLVGVMFQVASNQTDEAAPTAGNKKSAGVGLWTFEWVFRKGTTTKLSGDNANVFNRPGVVVSRRTLTHDRGQAPQAGWDGNGGDTRRQHRVDLFLNPRGLARSGSKTQVQLASDASATNAHYVGAKIKFIAGPGAGQESYIVGYTGGTTQTASLSPELTTAVGANSRYVIGYAVVAGEHYHNVLQNKTSPNSDNWCSVNSLALRTGSIRNEIPFGLNPARRFGPMYVDGRIFYTLRQTNSGAAEGSDVYRYIGDQYATSCWIYDVDGSDFKFGIPYEYTGSPEPRWQCYVGGNNRLRQRWRHVYGKRKFRYLEVWGGWLTSAVNVNPYTGNKFGRPSSPLVCTITNETDGGSVTAQLSPVASPAIANTTPTTINGWSQAGNDDTSTFWMWNRFDFGSSGVELLNGKVYKIEFNSTDANAWYYLPGHQDINVTFGEKFGARILDNNGNTTGWTDEPVVGELHSGLGYLNHWREAPAGPAGRSSFMERSTNGGSTWGGMALFGNSNRQDISLPVWFNWT